MGGASGSLAVVSALYLILCQGTAYSEVFSRFPQLFDENTGTLPCDMSECFLPYPFQLIFH